MNGTVKTLEAFLNDEADAPVDHPIFPELRPAREVAPVHDDGMSVYVPGLDPRLRPVGVVGASREVSP